MFCLDIYRIFLKNPLCSNKFARFYRIVHLSSGKFYLEMVRYFKLCILPLFSAWKFFFHYFSSILQQHHLLWLYLPWGGPSYPYIKSLLLIYQITQLFSHLFCNLCFFSLHWEKTSLAWFYIICLGFLQFWFWSSKSDSNPTTLVLVCVNPHLICPTSFSNSARIWSIRWGSVTFSCVFTHFFLLPILVTDHSGPGSCRGQKYGPERH